MCYTNLCRVASCCHLKMVGMPHTITIGCQCKSQVYCNDYFISVTFQIILYGIKKQLNSKFRDCNRLKPGIHDTSFASKSPFMKTWIKKTWIQVCVYTMQEILMNTHKFLRDTTNKMAFLGGEEAGWWFSSGTAVSSTNKFDPHDITEILLKVALNTITITLITTEKDTC